MYKYSAFRNNGILLTFKFLYVQFRSLTKTSLVIRTYSYYTLKREVYYIKMYLYLKSLKQQNKLVNKVLFTSMALQISCYHCNSDLAVMLFTSLYKAA